MASKNIKPKIELKKLKGLPQENIANLAEIDRTYFACFIILRQEDYGISYGDFSCVEKTRLGTYFMELLVCLLAPSQD
ncbi:hypothetical protein LPB87_08510 [Flavobacterium sp. EDS]|uniref:hypothetical protein n=1 Tax=Flavobacterium sp. EDS TaxID=2897328 RepID=UPI001E41523E|nr:hypothetical protein [Flavobacterium sp. EDS]MCD0474437.1 hypothetical protein [Flavobacterium sp. EDS]